MDFSLFRIQDPCGDFIGVFVGASRHVLSIIDNGEDGGLDLVSADDSFVYLSCCTLAEILNDLPEQMASALGY